ncbi:Smr/MutS family protein [Plastorhodobacter daqingensis]|uniref:Smr/MutS family protein n=1 Tax=Plastorhodobacter daqingensis TaxID=1387281 RepID=A0ABW2UF94_9RHOB
MARRTPRGLRPDEQDLWHQVAASAVPLRKIVQRPVETAAAPPVQGPRPPLPEFSIGQKTRDTHPAHDLAPPASEDLARSPLRMDRKSFERMSRGKLVPEARIDLHGMTVAQAHPALTRFILASHAAERRLVLVITGKGRPGQDDGPIPQHPGVLKRQVPQWLAAPPLGPVVLQLAQAHLRHGGAGAYYVYLRRPR